MNLNQPSFYIANPLKEENKFLKDVTQESPNQLIFMSHHTNYSAIGLWSSNIKETLDQWAFLQQCKILIS